MIGHQAEFDPRSQQVADIAPVFMFQFYFVSEGVDGAIDNGYLPPFQLFEYFRSMDIPGVIHGEFKLKIVHHAQQSGDVINFVYVGTKAYFTDQ